MILLGEALFNCEDYESLISFLEKEPISFESTPNDPSQAKFLHSIRFLLIGKAYEMQENKQPAIRNYILSLQYDPSNHEAFDILISHQLINLDSKNNLLQNLTFANESLWLYDYYKSRIDDNIYMMKKQM